MGRASNRKKLRRQAGLSTEDARRSPAEPAQRLAMEQVIAALRAITEQIQTERERVAAAARVWCGGSDPVPAHVPPWPDGSLGDRFFSGTLLDEARSAPCLPMSDVPNARVIASDPAHWTVAVRVLVRAVLLDSVPVDDQAVTMIIDALGPVVEAELAYQAVAEQVAEGAGSWQDLPEFPETNGPVFLLGGCALVDATWAVLGDDSLPGILDVMARSLDGAVAGLDGQVVAEALIGAFAQHYRCEMPGDIEVLERVGASVSGDPLEDLVAAGAVAPEDVLRAGLVVLSALGELCKSKSLSVLREAA